MKKLGSEHTTQYFAPNVEPAIEIEVGEPLVLETKDTFIGAIKDENDLVEGYQLEDLNACTGPVFVKGAKAGDTLVVRILDIKCSHKGVICLVPGAGFLVNKVNRPVTKVVKIADDKVIFSERISFPINPLVGIIGTALARDKIHTTFVGDHGGNIDCKEIGPGALVYLPVNVDGALFAVGDVHAAQGDGEMSTSAVEVDAEITVVFDVIKNEKVQMPIVKAKNRWFICGHREDIDSALTAVVEYGVQLIMRKWGMNLEDTLMLLTQVGDLQISQYCIGDIVGPSMRLSIPQLSGLPPFFREVKV